MVWRGNPGSGADARRVAAGGWTTGHRGAYRPLAPSTEADEVRPILRTGASTAVIRWPGELAIGRLLTVAETCDVQHLNILAYLSAGILCHRRRQPFARC